MTIECYVTQAQLENSRSPGCDYRYHLILKSPSREKLNTLLRAMLAYAAGEKIPRTQIIVDVDAIWLM